MLSALPAFIDNYLQWWIPGIVVVLGLLVYGLGDLLRFSPRRAWAISSVSFAESIRRRVLWITPLAILGVIIVSQLQKPTDEQDAIRQTTKFALFATGMLVTVTAVILACTNLPKEIDSRVIYTVVTKPTTRLEIVVGKIIGFAKVSLAILLIMGIFTLGYLHLRAWSMRRYISQRLESGLVDPALRPTYEYWASEGLLTSRTIEQPNDVQVFAREPEQGQSVRWFYGGGEGELSVPFNLSPDDLTPKGAGLDAVPGQAGVFLQLHIGFGGSNYGQPKQPASNLPVGVAAPTSTAPTTRGTTPANASLSIQILDENDNTLVDARMINNAQPIKLTDPTARTPVLVQIAPEAAMNLTRSPVFYVNVIGVSSGVEYFAPDKPNPDPHQNAVCVIVPGQTKQDVRVFPSTLDGQTPVGPTFHARSGVYGEQLRGGAPDKAPVAIFAFHDAQPQSEAGQVGFELRTGIETNDEETESPTEAAEGTRVQVRVVNHESGQRSQPVMIYPENSRTIYFNLPASDLKGGDFDLELRNLSEGDYVGIRQTTLSMIASQESFVLNLVKSLAILWMLSILVVVISIFCSTFLSWPIAIVLTLVILLGHWGVLQLGDATAPGIGNLVATDLGFRDPSKAKVVSASVEALSKLLNIFAGVLPDIGRFSAIEDIEQGITISRQTLLSPLLVLATFGLPMLVLSYVFLRNKEVAP